MTVVHVPGVGKRFRCEPYRGAMSPENCERRQRLARAGDERFGLCVTCQQGPSVTGQIQVTPCAAEGCRLAASPIHESGLCLTHARERKVEVEDIADKTLSSLAEAVRAAGAATTVVGAVVQSSRCTRDGCKRPPAKSPAKIEGGEGLCREHRGALARAAKKAAEAKAPAPLTMPDTEPMAAREKLIAANARAVDSLRDAVQDVESGVRPPEPVRIGDLELPIVPKGMAAAADVPRIELRASALRVYVAAPKEDVIRARERCVELSAIDGVQIVSNWHDVVQPGATDPEDYEEARRILGINNSRLRQADIVVALTRDGVGRDTYREIGQALADMTTVVWSVEHGGKSLAFADDLVIPAPLDNDIVRIVRGIASAWRRAA